MFDLTGKVAIVTGSSRGIGKAIAICLAEAGVRVVVSSRRQAECDAVAEAINAQFGDSRAVAIRASISSKADLEQLHAKTIETWGRLDILICNAATNTYMGPSADITDEQFRKILDTNVLANHWLIHLAAPGMYERRDGAIVIVSSIGGLVGSRVIGAYNISKAADMQLARNLAVEFGSSNIRVNCIAPGLIKTDFSQALWSDPKVLEYYQRHTPLARIGLPDDVAGAAVFLCSPAAAFVTGQTIVVDGGVSIAGI